jgi:P22 coat protein - gene protein 5
MAVTTLDRISSVLLEALSRQITLPACAQLVSEADYLHSASTGKARVRIAGARTAHDYSGSITRTALADSYADVTVGRVYDAIELTTDQSSLVISDLAAQVLIPMSQAVASKAEDHVATALATVSSVGDFDPDNVWTSILAMRKSLVDSKAPVGNRFLVVGSAVAAAILAAPQVVATQSNGGDPSALREATIANLAGFAVVESQAVDQDSAYAFHRSALLAAFLAPAAPEGAAAVSETLDGVGLRVVKTFDSTTLNDVLAVDAYVGASISDSARIVRYDIGS